MMKRKYLSGTIVNVGMLMLWVYSFSTASAFSGGGSGTQADPFRITTAGQFAEIKDGNASNIYYRLETDLELAKPLSLNFAARLEGNGKHVTLAESNNAGFGLFENCMENSTISNVNVIIPANVTITASSGGGICLSSQGTISSCTVDIYGALSASSFAGGICGRNSAGTILNSTVNIHSGGRIFVNSSNFSKVGGICGENYGTVSGCFVLIESGGTLSANSSSESYAGGICGDNYSTISNSTGNIKGVVSGASLSGGSCGYNRSQVSNVWYVRYNIHLGSIGYNYGIYTGYTVPGTVAGKVSPVSGWELPITDQDGKTLTPTGTYVTVNHANFTVINNKIVSNKGIPLGVYDVPVTVTPKSAPPFSGTYKVNAVVYVTSVQFDKNHAVYNGLPCVVSAKAVYDGSPKPSESVCEVQYKRASASDADYSGIPPVHAGEYDVRYIITDTNYEFQYGVSNTAFLTITPKAWTVSAYPATIRFREPFDPPSFILTLAGEDKVMVSESCSYKPGKSPVGNYTIIPVISNWQKTRSSNYQISYQNAVLTVSPAFDLHVLNGSGAGNYLEYMQIPVSAETLPGKVFSYWSTDSGGSFTNPTLPETIFTMPANHVAIRANFRDMEKTDAPVFSRPDGLFSEPFTLSLTCSTPGASIYYAVNGSDSRLYREPLQIRESSQITAVALKYQYLNSDVSAVSYIRENPKPDIYPVVVRYSDVWVQAKDFGLGIGELTSGTRLVARYADLFSGKPRKIRVRMNLNAQSFKVKSVASVIMSGKYNSQRRKNFSADILKDFQRDSLIIEVSVKYKTVPFRIKMIPPLIDSAVIVRDAFIPGKPVDYVVLKTRHAGTKVQGSLEYMKFPNGCRRIFCSPVKPERYPEPVQNVISGFPQGSEVSVFKLKPSWLGFSGRLDFVINNKIGRGTFTVRSE